MVEYYQGVAMIADNIQHVVTFCTHQGYYRHDSSIWNQQEAGSSYALDKK
jgi:hypothetical protein